MTAKGSGRAAARRWAVYGLFVASASLLPRRASAEIELANINGWQVISDGRAGGFVSWAHGDGYPQPTYATDTNGNYVPLSSPIGGGWKAVTNQGVLIDPTLTGGTVIPNQGTIDLWRVRSGMIANVFGFGVRSPITPGTRFISYVQFWAYIENNGRQKNLQNVPDARQGYAGLEGPWGTLLAGRMRGLFSRGNTDIDVLYAHRWGLGFPGNLDNNGPTQGQLGFGVLGSSFSSGITYATPVAAGLQLTVGLFDPVQLQGFGGWTRTEFLRPEAEAMGNWRLGGLGRLVIFINGTYQKVFKDSYCTSVPNAPGAVYDMDTMKWLPCDETIAGGAAGLRLELGPFHLGLSGYYGQGLGLNYALEVSDAAQDREGNLRTESGEYVQLQVVIRKFDLFAGGGIAKMYLTDYDNKHRDTDPRDTTGASLAYKYNFLKDQIGFNAGIVYNVTPSLNFDLDFFRAQADWFGANNFPGQKQVVWVSNGGMMANW